MMRHDGWGEPDPSNLEDDLAFNRMAVELAVARTVLRDLIAAAEAVRQHAIIYEADWSPVEVALARARAALP